MITVRTRATNAIHAVIFDVDGVLLDSREANIAWYRAFLAGHGYGNIGEDVLAQGHHMNLREAIAFVTKAPEERVTELWQAGRALEDYPDHLLRLPWRCRETLEALSRRYPLAIVTGRLREGIDQFFAFSGLGALFTSSIGYEDYARPKPDPEPLLVASQRLEIEPRHAVYVGDAPLDYECALAAGMRFIAYGDGVPEAGSKVSCFDALEAALAGLCP